MKKRSEAKATTKAASANRQQRLDLLAGLNPEQVEVVRHDAGPCRVLALAGSGKTESLSRRIARMVSGGVDPRRILAVTFSKKGADEMSARIAKKFGVAGARVGTWHSLCLEILHEDQTEQAAWTIEGERTGRGPGTSSNPKMILKEVLGYKHMNWVGADVSTIDRFIGHCKANLFAPDSPEAAELAKKTFGWQATKATHAFHLYDELLAERMLLTFDDFLVFAAQHLSVEENRVRWAAKWDFVMQDEAQDANRAQCTIARLLAKDHGNYMVIGDCYQCHPPNVRVDVGEGQTVAIDCLKDGDTVRAWNRQSQKMVGGRKIKIASRPYSGRMLTMVAAERTVDMTPNHRLLVRWADRGAETCVTYLMWREGFGYRVGWCQLFNKQGMNHFAHRARLEKADKAWILGVHRDRTEASLEESIIATKHGIPTITFEPVEGAKHITAETIRRMFDAVSGDNEERGRAVLAAFGRHAEFPMLPWIDGQAVKRTYFECFACNLIPGHMSIPLPDATNAWTTIDGVSSRHYDGPVYSLDVERDHSYSANGLVVLNSIYGFRGSSPEFLAKFDAEWPGARTIVLPRNYRSGKRIIATANAIVAPAKIDGLDSPSTMLGERALDGVVKVAVAEDLDGEATNITATIVASVALGESKYSDHTILFRTNAQSRALEEALLARRVPYVVVGGTSFYERKEVRDLLAYLRIADRRGSTDDIKRSINTPFRFLGAKFVERVMAAAEHEDRAEDWCRIVDEVAGQTGLQQRQVASATEWARMLRAMTGTIEAGGDAARPAVILEDIVRATKYIDYLNKEEGGETTADSAAANVREMVRVAERFATVGELLDYIDETIRTARKQREDKQAGGERVLLMSVHRSKGLEWPHVYVVGMNEMILPHVKGDPEEERRLAYVAATRARDVLTLSYVRRIATRAGLKDVEPSRFLLDTGLSLDAPTTAPSESVVVLDNSLQ